MTIARAAYRNFSSAQIAGRLSNTCSRSDTGSAVNCTDCTTNLCENVLGIANTSNITQLFDASSINHWSAWGPTRRTVSSGILTNSHYTGNRDISNAFCGYNHSAPTPHWDSGGSNTWSLIQSGQSQTFSCVLDICELLMNDIQGVANQPTHVHFSVWDGSSWVTNASSVIALSSAVDGAGNSNSIIDFSQSGTRITISNITATKTYTLKIWFCSSGTFDYQGANIVFKMNEFADYTHQVRISSANHFYVNGPYNDSTATGASTFTSGRWDVNGAQIVLSTGLMSLNYLNNNAGLGSGWGDTGYDHLHMNIVIELGYYSGSTWTVISTESTSGLQYDGSWNQPGEAASMSNVDVWTPSYGMDSSGYGYRFVINCVTS